MPGKFAACMRILASIPIRTQQRFSLIPLKVPTDPFTLCKITFHPVTDEPIRDRRSRRCDMDRVATCTNSGIPRNPWRGDDYNPFAREYRLFLFLMYFFAFHFSMCNNICSSLFYFNRHILFLESGSL